MFRVGITPPTLERDDQHRRRPPRGPRAALDLFAVVGTRSKRYEARRESVGK
jgi:hypothetical protein